MVGVRVLEARCSRQSRGVLPETQAISPERISREDIRGLNPKYTALMREIDTTREDTSVRNPAERALFRSVDTRTRVGSSLGSVQIRSQSAVRRSLTRVVSVAQKYPDEN